MKYFLLFILHAGSFGHFFGLLFVAGFRGYRSNALLDLEEDARG